MTPEELVAALEQRILGTVRLTADEVIGAGHAERADAEELWTGLGFPPVGEGAVSFTDVDAEVLASLVELRELGLAGPEVIVPMTRVLGQALSRVAAAQVEAFREGLEEAAAGAESSDEVEEVLATVTELLLPGFERFIGYVWRRHLAAALRRGLVEHRSSVEVVGFADLVDYTRETRELADTGLGELLDRFQRVAYEQITAAGARIVKVVGDGVMFVAADPVAGATAALGLVAACEADDGLTGVRVGLASGHVVALEGDLFGETVNRASRLSDVAHPHTVLADDELGELLAAGGHVYARRTRPHRLKGLGSVDTWVIRPLRQDQHEDRG